MTDTVKLPEGSIVKIENHEREFGRLVAEAHGTEYTTGVYNRDTDIFTFSFEVDPDVVIGLYESFIHDPLWARTDDERRFVELAEAEERRSLAPEEDAELARLHRKLMVRQLRYPS